jgi:hypothetical protein
MDGHLARTADDQGLALARGHRLDPLGFLSTARPVEILQAPDVVDLEGRARAAELAFVRLKPPLQSRPAMPDHTGMSSPALDGLIRR